MCYGLLAKHSVLFPFFFLDAKWVSASGNFPPFLNVHQVEGEGSLEDQPCASFDQREQTDPSSHRASKSLWLHNTIVVSDRFCVRRLTLADKAAVMRAKGKSSLAWDVVPDLLIADVPRTRWSWIKSQLAIWQPAAFHIHKKNGHWILLFWLNDGGTSGSSRDITHRHNNDNCKEFNVD